MNPASLRNRTLDELDELLAMTRYMIGQPAYRRYVLDRIGHPHVGIALLRVLRVLSRQGNLTIREIAAQLGIDHSTASRAVRDAKREGWVTSTPSATDSRQRVVSLTAYGESIVATMTEARRDVVRRATDEWDEADIRLLNELLARLLSTFAVPE